MHIKQMMIPHRESLFWRWRNSKKTKECIKRLPCSFFWEKVNKTPLTRTHHQETSKMRVLLLQLETRIIVTKIPHLKYLME